MPCSHTYSHQPIPIGRVFRCWILQTIRMAWRCRNSVQAPGDPGLPVLKIKELGQGMCSADSERCTSEIDESVTIHDGDLVFSWSGTLLLDFWAGGEAGLNQHLFKVTSEKYPSWLYYLWTKRHMNRFIMLAKDRATTMGHIKRGALADSEVLLPPAKQLEELTQLMQPIVDQRIASKVQSRRLATLRDALLPGSCLVRSTSRGSSCLCSQIII